jgi:hypothetical protein
MSNVEQGIMNVEVRMFLLDCFGANNAHKWNLNRFSLKKITQFNVLSLFCIAPVRAKINFGFFTALSWIKIKGAKLELYYNPGVLLSLWLNYYDLRNFWRLRETRYGWQQTRTENPAKGGARC